MKKVKVVHISDLHYSPENVAEADKCTGFAINYAAENIPDLIVVSGDTTHHRIDIHSDSAKRLIGRIKQASNIAPVLLLQGTFSHEPQGTLESISNCEGKYPIFVANKLQQVILTDEGNFVSSHETHFFADNVDLLQKAKCLITAIPVLNQAAIAAEAGTGRNIQYEMRQHILKYIDISSVFTKMANGLGVPTIGISHGTVYRSITETGFMLTKDHEFTAEEIFDTGCKAFMLGHIHLHQHWCNEDGQVAAYPGSIGCFHFGEDQPKGFLDWEISAEHANFKFVQTPAKLKKTVTFNSEPDLAELAKLNEFEGEVRIQYLVNEENVQCIDKERIQSLMPNAKLTFDQRVVRIHRSRAEGISLEADVAGKLAHWSKSTGESIGNLQYKLQQLQTKTPAEIVRDTLAIV